MNWDTLLLMLNPPLESSVHGITLYVLLLAIGMIIGMLTGFFGIGGGFLVVPLLHIFAGIPYQTAVGSSLTLILGTSFTGFLKQRSSGNIEISVAMYLGMGSVLGAVLGDALQNFLYVLSGAQDDIFNLSMHGIILVLLFSIIMLFRYKGSEKDQETLPLMQRINFPPSYRISTSEDRSISIVVTFFTGMVLGILTGLIGIGGGVILLPLLIGMFGLPHRKAAGTSLTVGLVTSTAAVITKGITDSSKIHLPLTMILLLTSIIGLHVGFSLLQRTGEKNFRKVFSYIIMLTIILIVIDGAGIISQWM